MPVSIKIAQVILLSSVKFVFGAPLAFNLGFGYVETLLLTTGGGIAGVLFFYHLSTAVLKLYRYLLRKIKNLFTKKQSEIQTVAANKKPKRKFTRKNKLIIKVRKKYGMLGIIAITPPLLSIPLGTFLVNKYYSGNKKNLLYLSLSVAAWSTIITSTYFLIAN